MGHTRLRGRTLGYAPVAFMMVILDNTVDEEESDATRKGKDDSTEEANIEGWLGQEGEQTKSYSAAVIDCIKRKSRIFVGDSIGRKPDSRLGKWDDVVVCLPRLRIEHVTKTIEQVISAGRKGSILVHIRMNNAESGVPTAIVKKYRNLPKRSKQAIVVQIMLSGILLVTGGRSEGCSNSRRIAINTLVL